MWTVGHLSHAMWVVNDTEQIPLPIVPQLRDEYLEHALLDRLSPSHPRFAEIVNAHARAVAAGEPCYEDPSTRLMVFTAAFLADRGCCCETGCRHCPFVVR